MDETADEPTANENIVERVDGRTARRDRNRDAVLDAVLELFAEGHLEPGPVEVAERSGVSPRSVYRYYEDMDSLVRAAMARNQARVQPLFLIPDLGRGELGDRVDRLVTARLHLYEATAPMMRASVLRAPNSRLLADRLTEIREALRQQVEQMFAPELNPLGDAERLEVAAALDVMVGFDALEHLRGHRDLSHDEARRVLIRSLHALIGTVGAAGPDDQAHPPA